jgi:hypothetical protein
LTAEELSTAVTVLRELLATPLPDDSSEDDRL